MHSDTKKLGELLVDAGLMTPAQLLEALRYQKAAGGRMGSNLVAMGIISDDSLMDFLAQQTGVPRLDVKHLDVLPSVLERIPRRLAEQMTILPVAFKEPKSLVLAMADPSDLNAVDSARFASGLTIEPMVASHSALRLAIADQYRKLESGTLGVTIDVNRTPVDESLPVNFELPSSVPTLKLPAPAFPRDPFFDGLPFKADPPPAGPFEFFVDPEAAPSPDPHQIIHARSAMGEQIQPIDRIPSRALLLGLIRLLQRRGILGTDELQRYIANLVEAGELPGGSTSQQL
ncbi:GspE/PulE/PilB domain-containing protein [Mesoterricola silvestris]|uniref:Type II secretion system protein GspE N-terminal domain-containing protein n=1 Tax=Mesoterricola silvestris TaxID=2927979 RepID=A0AA48K7D5_9BACT|nr:hypothetical protein [Mesoterricola silvestris]BDU71749.1 hypothetical protein METEAL_09230 [Mesoterricola silvestris]